MADVYFVDGSCDGSGRVRVGYAGQVAQFGHGRQGRRRLITDEFLPHEIASAVIRRRHHQHPLEALRQTLPHPQIFILNYIHFNDATIMN